MGPIRTHGRIMMKRNSGIKKFGFYTIIGLLIALSIFGFKYIEQNKDISVAAFMEGLSKEQVNENNHLVVPGEDNKDLGDIQSIIEYGTNAPVGVHYPVFDKNNVDSISKALVDQYIEEFKNELVNYSYVDKDSKYELNIDYETYSAPGNVVSIVFTITRDSSAMAHPDVMIATKVYDLSNDMEIDLNTIMEGEYLNHISQICENYFRNDENYKDNIDSSLFKEGIQPLADNYANFILKEDRIIFKFAKYQLFSGNFGMPSVEIPYSDLKGYLRPEFAKLFTLEEKPQQTDSDSEKPKVDIILPQRVLDPNKPMVALTFDDGPNKSTTVPILDTLKEYNSAATFFVLGNRVSNNVDILERMLEEGSEIGNHSYNHKELTKLSYEELMEQITKTQEAIIEATGYEPKLMRPTYGSYNDELKSGVCMPLILWSIDTLDWKSKSSRRITDHVLGRVKDGDIILMHDIYGSTAEAVELLVPELINRGYQLVTISELYESKEKSLECGQIYY